MNNKISEIIIKLRSITKLVSLSKYLNLLLGK